MILGTVCKYMIDPLAHYMEGLPNVEGHLNVAYELRIEGAAISSHVYKKTQRGHLENRTVPFQMPAWQRTFT